MALFNRAVHQTRHGYKPRSSNEAFIVPLLAEAIGRSFARFVEPGQGRKAIDVGCGGQPFRPDIERLGYRYAAMDVSQNVAGTVDVVAQIDQPLPPELLQMGPFHFVLCTEVLEHVEDWRMAFANISILMAPGGKLLVTCPHFYHLHEEPYDFWRATPHALARFGTAAGLRIVHQERLGNGWDVLGTLLACTPPRRAGRSFPGRVLAAAADVARKAAFVLVRTRLPHRMVPLDGTVYLSNLFIFERPEQ